MSRFRLAIVASHVIQYQDPFFRLLAQEEDLDLEVLYCSRAGIDDYHDADMQTTLRWDLPLLEGYRSRFLKNFGFGEGYTRLINPSVVSTILFGRYDAVIFFAGWGTVTSLAGIAACRAAAVPFFLYGDSSFPPEAHGLRGRLRDGFLRSLVGLASGFMVSGVLNGRYYAHYGADEKTFFSLPWAIDNERFAVAARMTAAERTELRSRAGASDQDLVLVFSAKLVPRKDPMTLLRAMTQMRNRHRVVAVFLGHGELRTELENLALQHSLRVHFAGFINQRELPRCYAMSDVFVLPSLVEPRGAVINEAMACGLPLVVTDRCGSIGDIVRHGENALIYPAGDAGALAPLLDQLADDPALRDSMARRSVELIAEWDFAAGVRGVLQAVRATC